MLLSGLAFMLMLRVWGRDRGRRSESRSPSCNVGDCGSCRPFLSPSESSVQSFGRGVGDTMSKIGQDVSPVSLQGFGRAYHWSQAGVRGPEVPTAKVVRRPLRIAISPELAQRFLDRPGASGF